MTASRLAAPPNSWPPTVQSWLWLVSVRENLMTSADLPRTGTPSFAGFGPVLNIGQACSAALAGHPMVGAVSVRAGALVAGVLLSLVVVAVPVAVIGLTVTQVNPSLAARNAPVVLTTGAGAGQPVSTGLRFP